MNLRPNRYTQDVGMHYHKPGQKYNFYTNITRTVYALCADLVNFEKQTNKQTNYYLVLVQNKGFVVKLVYSTIYVKSSFNLN